MQPTGARGASKEEQMLVRLGSFAVKDGMGAGLRRAHLEKVLPHVGKQPGLVASLLLEPQAAGAPFVACTIWQTGADAERYEKSGEAAAVVGMLKEFLAGPPTLQTYEAHSQVVLPPPGR
jgi:heme-degrading monooxygenase HmoA